MVNVWEENMFVSYK